MIKLTVKPSIVDRVISVSPSFTDRVITVTPNIGAILYSSSYPDYVGPYCVDPDFEAHVLGTANKVMKNDVTVNPVTYSLATRADIDRLF